MREALIERSVAGRGGHALSWQVFTPTELLKQYVKEAFARENIPASDRRTQTSADYRRELARNKFGLLRTSAGRGLLVKTDLQSLQDNAVEAANSLVRGLRKLASILVLVRT